MWRRCVWYILISSRPLHVFRLFTVNDADLGLHMFLYNVTVCTQLDVLD